MTATHPGTWRILARAWRAIVVAVLVNATIQALLVVGQPATALDPWFVLRVAASTVSLILLGAALAEAADAAAASRRLRPLRPAVLAWSATVVVVAAAAWVVTPFAVPFVLVLGLVLLPVGTPARFAVRALRPVRAVLAGALTIVLALVSWIVGLVSGFFVTGPLGALLAWIFAGCALAVTVALWTALHRPST